MKKINYFLLGFLISMVIFSPSVWCASYVTLPPDGSYIPVVGANIQLPGSDQVGTMLSGPYSGSPNSFGYCNPPYTLGNQSCGNERRLYRYYNKLQNGCYERNEWWYFYQPCPGDDDYKTIADYDPILPSHCSNGVQDSGETGIDCGGSCNDCNSFTCPPNYIYISDNLGGLCYYSLSGNFPDSERPVPDAFGNCPSPYIQKCVDGDCRCQLSPDFPSPEPTPAYTPDGASPPVAPADPSAPPPPDVALSPIESSESATTTKTEQIINNQDGTSTKIETTTTTSTGQGPGQSSAATSTTTTTREITYSDSDGTGTVLSDVTTTQTTKEGPPEENPENYNFGGVETDIDDEKPSNFNFEEDNKPDWDELKTDLDPMLDEVEDAFTGSEIDTSGAACSISFELLGRNQTISICGFQDQLETAGNFLLAFTYILGLVWLVEKS